MKTEPKIKRKVHIRTTKQTVIRKIHEQSSNTGILETAGGRSEKGRKKKHLFPLHYPSATPFDTVSGK